VFIALLATNTLRVISRVCIYVQANVTLKWEATHMNSSEGENIMFLSSTLLEGPVEVRLFVCLSVCLCVLSYSFILFDSGSMAHKTQNTHTYT